MNCVELFSTKARHHTIRTGGDLSVFLIPTIKNSLHQRSRIHSTFIRILPHKLSRFLLSTYQLLWQTNAALYGKIPWVNRRAKIATIHNTLIGLILWNSKTVQAVAPGRCSTGVPHRHKSLMLPHSITASKECKRPTSSTA